MRLLVLVFAPACAAQPAEFTIFLGSGEKDLSPLRTRIEENRNRLRRSLREAARLGLRPCLSTDEILISTVALESMSKRIAHDGNPRRVDLGKEAVWELHHAKFREVLRAFPQDVYGMVRTGENYPFGGRREPQGSHLQPQHRSRRVERSPRC
jgi:hypothetical protein